MTERDYAKRPLTEEEQVFAEENHELISYRLRWEEKTALKIYRQLVNLAIVIKKHCCRKLTLIR